MSNLINQQVAFDLLMSRAQELTGITGDLGGACIGAAKLIKSLPSADPKTGEWIFNPKDAIESMFTLPKCSECGFESSDGGNFCSNCGARMLREDGEEE